MDGGTQNNNRNQSPIRKRTRVRSPGRRGRQAIGAEGLRIMSAGAVSRWGKPAFIPIPVHRYGLFLGVIAYVYWVLSPLPFDWERIQEGLPRAMRIVQGAFPPSFARPSLLIDGFVESLQIALLATIFGLLLRLPLPFMAARTLHRTSVVSGQSVSVRLDLG